MSHIEYAGSCKGEIFQDGELMTPKEILKELKSLQHENNLMRIKCNAFVSKLSKCDIDIIDLTVLSDDRKNTIDMLSSENGKLLRKLKRKNHK